jgi:ribosome-associated protein
VASGDREVRVRPGLVIPGSALEIRFSRSGGPGGQNVNKVETKAEVRFDLAATALLTPDEKARVMAKLASRLTKDGILAVSCERTRHRERNLNDALFRMGEILREALHRPKKRRPTRPTRSSKRQRIDEKRRRGEIKRMRSGPGDE